MAYMKELGHLCRLCPARATQEVFDTWNYSHGYFCTRHAVLRRDALQREEQASRVPNKGNEEP